MDEEQQHKTQPKLTPCAGVLVYSNGKVLVSHTTTSYDCYIRGEHPLYDNQWTINKGAIGDEQGLEDETALNAALRELQEEAGINMYEYPDLLSQMITRRKTSSSSSASTSSSSTSSPSSSTSSTSSTTAGHLFEFNTPSRKHVKVFLVVDEQGILQQVDLKCSSWVSSLRIPEVDAFMWVSLEEAEKMVLVSQKWMFQEETFKKALNGELLVRMVDW
jgi:predicted NUDIX family NTP pyrophosphohydrolase